jgi:hypothetical protein
VLERAVCGTPELGALPRFWPTALTFVPAGAPVPVTVIDEVPAMLLRVAFPPVPPLNLLAGLPLRMAL